MIASGPFIRRFGGAMPGPTANRYGLVPPPGQVLPGMDYGQAPTQPTFGMNSSGRASDASAKQIPAPPRNLAS